jgi:predicted dehydrogenase
MLDCLVYPMSRLVSLLGPAKRVSALVNTLIPQRIVGDGKRVHSDVDDNVTLLVEWPGGQQAVVRTLWGTSFSRNDSVVYGRKGTLWLAGGAVVLHSPHRPIPDATPVEWQGFENCYRVTPRQGIPAESMIGHFVTCIHTRRQPYCSGHLQLHVHEILFKGYRAAETGQTQNLETTFTLWHTMPPEFYDTRSRWV